MIMASVRRRFVIARVCSGTVPRVLLSIVAVALVGSSARADLIALRGGGQVTGKVLPDPDHKDRVHVWLLQGRKPLSFSKSQIVQITPQASALDPYFEKLKTVASTAKTVTVTVDATDVVSVSQAAHVTITLPDGTTTGGTIIAIGTSVQSGTQSSDGQPQQTVTVAPDDTSAVASLTSAQVQVNFTGQTAAGVLAVPVTALLALSGGGYALQLPDGQLIRVTTGLFAQGLVQVSGAGVRPGMQVVTSG